MIHDEYPTKNRINSLFNPFWTIIKVEIEKMKLAGKDLNKNLTKLGLYYKKIVKIHICD